MGAWTGDVPCAFALTATMSLAVCMTEACEGLVVLKKRPCQGNSEKHQMTRLDCSPVGCVDLGQVSKKQLTLSKHWRLYRCIRDKIQYPRYAHNLLVGESFEQNHCAGASMFKLVRTAHWCRQPSCRHKNYNCQQNWMSANQHRDEGLPQNHHPGASSD